MTPVAERTAVICPLCHTAAPVMTEEALSGRADWRCPHCQQNWTAERLATVAAYADYCAQRAKTQDLITAPAHTS